MANKSLHTPRGIARFPKLVTPDQFDTSSKPAYSTGLVFDPKDPEVQTFVETLEGIHKKAEAELRKELEEAITNAKNGAEAKKAKKKLDDLEIPSFIREVLDRESGEPTGMIEIKFKTNADDKDGNRKALRFFDGSGKAFKLTEDLWSGSVLRVNFNPSTFYIAGVGKLFLTNYINAVQVLELKQGSGGSTAGDMFGGDTSDFEAPTEPSFNDGVEEISADSVTDGDY